MSLAASFEVKGWCPGALRPMASGDGLIARVRPWCGAFSLTQASGLAEIAGRLGNGHMDLTRRANLQIRGLSEDRLSELHAALDRLDLLDASPEAEAARNVMVGPLAGAEVRAVAAQLSYALSEDRRAAGLPAKFGWLVDGGGPLSIVSERADIALSVTDDGMALRVDGQWLRGGSVEVALDAAFGRRPDLPKVDIVPVPGRRRLGHLAGAIHSELKHDARTGFQIGCEAFHQAGNVKENIPAAVIGPQESEAFCLEISDHAAWLLARRETGIIHLAARFTRGGDRAAGAVAGASEAARRLCEAGAADGGRAAGGGALSAGV